MGQPILAVEKLRLDANPFLPGAKRERVGRPLQTALGEVIRQTALETPVVIVAGSAGTGKSLLADMAERAFSDMGLSVRQIHRGDLVAKTPEKYDVLLVDEADSLTDSGLQLLEPGGNRPATTTILLCLPSSVRRLSSVADTAVVELTRLTQSDTRAYLLQRAGNTGLRDLFAPDALDLIVDASRGLPRTLWSIASLAYFSAAYDGSPQIGRHHIAGALASQMTMHKIEPEVVPEPAAVSEAPPASVPESPPAPASDIFVFETALATLSEPAPAPETPVVETPVANMAELEPAPAPHPLVRPSASDRANARRPLFAMGRLAVTGIAFAAAAVLAVIIPALLISGKPEATASVNSPSVAIPAKPQIIAPPVQTPAPALPTAAADAAPKPAEKTAPAAKTAGPAQTTNVAKTATESVKAQPPAANPPAPSNAAAERATAAAEAAVQAAQDAERAKAAAAELAAQQEVARARAAQETAEQVRTEVARILAEKQEADRIKAEKEAAEQAQAEAARAQFARDAAARVNASMQAARAAAEQAARAKAAEESAARDRSRFQHSLFGVGN
jgi:hypothetical protein